ncbi:hypothetical protein D0Z08_30270 [Nocardioides immobilis]|uniref:Uncharacterized protein n=1 Tax=Nocardioides immobilis TaxID=2049295 RepID=A0A417XSL2_9ACTN|nr:hypothetical protein [Nocardioides immobilis]RHW23310.1 hypothetical protein D0Z08_30270 [Nocardioides immobilis]
MTSIPMSEERPTEKIMLGLLVVGLALQVAGCITAYVQAPRTELGPRGVVEEGDRTVTLIAVLGFGLGGAMSLTAVVAFGVLLGLRAHAER